MNLTNIILIIVIFICFLFVVLATLQILSSQKQLKNLKENKNVIGSMKEICKTSNVYSFTFDIDFTNTLMMNDPNSTNSTKLDYQVVNSSYTTIHHFICGNSFQTMKAKFIEPIHLVLNDSGSFLNNYSDISIKYIIIDGNMYFIKFDKTWYDSGKTSDLGKNKLIITLFKIKSDLTEFLSYSNTACVDITVPFLGNISGHTTILDTIKQNKSRQNGVFQALCFSITI
jgi:hypothetical protein